MYKLIEKDNPLACHGIGTKTELEHHLTHAIPSYCAKGYFMNKTLTPESFKIVPCQFKTDLV